MISKSDEKKKEESDIRSYVLYFLSSSVSFVNFAVHGDGIICSELFCHSASMGALPQRIPNSFIFLINKAKKSFYRRSYICLYLQLQDYIVPFAVSGFFSP